MHSILRHQTMRLFLIQLLLINVALSSSDQVITTNEKKTKPWPPATSSNPAVTDLHAEYHNIFRHGNRNAASHLWASFLIDRSLQMTPDRLNFFFTGFCSISGSPVRPSDYTRYRVTLPMVNSTPKRSMTGFMYYCCWPCICDTQDFIRVDTLTIVDVDGVAREENFAVIGNPCDDPGKLQEPFSHFGRSTTTLAQTAQEVRCSADGVLEGATVSDNGYIIIGMFFDAVKMQSGVEESGGGQVAIQRVVDNPIPGRITTTSVLGKSVNFHDESEWYDKCSERARDGYNSGMGEIFRKVCSISPIDELFTAVTEKGEVLILPA